MMPSVTFHIKQILIIQDNQIQYLNFWGKKINKDAEKAESSPMKSLLTMKI